MAVERTRVDLVGLGLVARNRLARDRALIDARLACFDQPVGRDTLPGAHDHEVAGRQLLDGDFQLLALAKHARAAGQALDELVDGGFGSSGRVGLEALAHQHDEHGLGADQVFADGQRCHRGDADRQVGRDTLLEQLADGALEGLVPGQQRQDDRCIDAQDVAEQTREVEQQKQPDRDGEADILHALARVFIDRVVFANDVQRCSR